MNLSDLKTKVFDVVLGKQNVLKVYDKKIEL